jgi:hypothetical protein
MVIPSLLVNHLSTLMNEVERAREALGFQVLRKMVDGKNLFWDLFRRAGVGMLSKSAELFDYTREPAALLNYATTLGHLNGLGITGVI